MDIVCNRMKSGLLCVVIEYSTCYVYEK